MQRKGNKQIHPCKQVWLFAGILHVLMQLILASQTFFLKSSSSKVPLSISHLLFLLPITPSPFWPPALRQSLCRTAHLGHSITSSERKPKHAPARCTYPAIVQSSHSEPVRCSRKKVADSALQIRPMIDFRNHFFGFCHFYAVLWDGTAAFWWRDV